MSALAAPLNESKGFYKSNKRTSIVSQNPRSDQELYDSIAGSFVKTSTTEGGWPKLFERGLLEGIS